MSSRVFFVLILALAGCSSALAGKTPTAKRLKAPGIEAARLLFEQSKTSYGAVAGSIPKQLTTAAAPKGIIAQSTTSAAGTCGLAYSMTHVAGPVASAGDETMLLMTSPLSPPNNQTPTVVTNCHELWTVMAAATALTVADNAKASKITITLSCAVSTNYTDCFDTTGLMSPLTNGNLVNGFFGFATLALAADKKTCTGGARPRIGGVSPTATASQNSGSPLLVLGTDADQDYIAMTTVTLTNIIVDGSGKRPCIATNSLKKMTMNNVDLINCMTVYSGAGLFAYDTPLSWKKGLISNSMAQGLSPDFLSFPGLGGGLSFTTQDIFGKVSTLTDVRWAPRRFGLPARRPARREPARPVHRLLTESALPPPHPQVPKLHPHRRRRRLLLLPRRHRRRLDHLHVGRHLQQPRALRGRRCLLPRRRVPVGEQRPRHSQGHREALQLVLWWV
jgi:hypothetical protein